MSPNMPPKLTFFFFLVAVTLHIGKWIKQMDVETASRKLINNSTGVGRGALLAEQNNMIKTFSVRNQ